jgi:hypothetical protein
VIAKIRSDTDENLAQSWPNGYQHRPLSATKQDIAFSATLATYLLLNRLVAIYYREIHD